MKTINFLLPFIVCILILSSVDLNAQNSNELIIKDSLRGFPLKQNGKVLTVAHLTKIFADNPNAREEFKAAKVNNDFGMVLGFTGGFLIGWPLGQAIGGGEPIWAMAGVGAGLLILSIPLGSAFKKRTLNAVDIYNNGLAEITEKEKVSFHLENTSSGIGIIMKF